MDEEKRAVGYRQPPVSSRFKKGQSGNPRGRPRNRTRQLPYDTVLGQMVTIREDGKEKRVTAAEAFILRLTKKGLEGCGASTRASLESIEKARRARHESISRTPIRIKIRIFGLCCIVEDLGLAIRLHEYDEDKVELKLKPWIVEAALARLGSRRLSINEQRIVAAATRDPEKVQWPEWWHLDQSARSAVSI